MTSTAQLEQALQRFLSQHPPKAGSLIITLFGDVISQHGNNVWLGSIIDSLCYFGLNDRQIRTAISRLVQEDWLQSIPRGRRSYYSFTPGGNRRFERVAHRIYAGSFPQWDAQWTLVMLSLMDSPVREQFRRELSWQGFGQINHGVFAHPSADDAVLTELIKDFDVADEILVLRATTSEITSNAAIEGLTSKAWKLSELHPRYEQFCELFSQLLQVLDDGSEELGERESFIMRLLLIHEYRRLLLKTPALPQDLLSSSLPAVRASELAAAVYAFAEKQSLSFIARSFESLNGPLPAVSDGFYLRFNH